MKQLIGRLGITRQVALVGALGNEQLALLGELKINLLEARRAEKDFLLRRADDYVARQEKAVRAAVSDVEALRRALSDAKAIATIDRFQPMLASYADLFGRVVKSARLFGFNENGGLQGSLRTSVHEIEETLKTGTDFALTSGMLTMRRHENDYLARGDVRYVDEMKKAASAFDQRLPRRSRPSKRLQSGPGSPPTRRTSLLLLRQRRNRRSRSLF